MLLDLLGHLGDTDAMASKILDISQDALGPEDPLVLLLCEVYLDLLPQRPDWSVRVVGAADIFLKDVLAQLVIEL